MLATMRSGAGNIFAKLLLGLLVLSFAAWGIGDIFQSRSQGSVATVGGEPVSLGEFQRMLNRQLQGMRRAMGPAYSPEMAQNLGIPQQVLDGLIARTLLRQEAQDLRLRVADKAAFAAIRANPSFQSDSGQFDKRLFQQAVDTLGMSQADYLTAVKYDEAQRLLIGPMLTDSRLPMLLGERIESLKNERRNLTILTLSAASLKNTDPATDQELQDYYREHQADFMQPETRTLSYIAFVPHNLSRRLAVSDDEIKGALAAARQETAAKEKRAVSHVLFKTQEEAQAAYSALAQGKSFDAVAKQDNILNNGTTDLGSLTRDQVPEGAGETVFALKEKGYSKPYETGFGWHVFTVRKIESATFDEKRMIGKIRDQLLAEKFEQQMPEISAKIDDMAAAGATLNEIADEFGLLPEQMVNTTREVSDEAKPLIEAGFALEEGQISSLVQGPEDFYVIRADKVTPSAARSFEQVRSDVTKRWNEEQRASLLSKRADAMRQALADGKAPQIVANEFGATLSTKNGVAPNAADAALPAPLLEESFTLAQGASTSTHKTASGTYVVAVVSSIAQQRPAAQKATTDNGMADAYARELAGQYMSYLHSRHKVQVDQEALNRLLEQSQ